MSGSTNNATPKATAADTAIAAVAARVAELEAQHEADTALIVAGATNVANLNAKIAALTAATPWKPAPIAEVSTVPVAVGNVRVTNRGRSIFMSANVAPHRVEIRTNDTVTVPAAFWQAWQAEYKGSDFAGYLTAVPV
jgi:Tfp pilus assembly protein FimV